MAQKKAMPTKEQMEVIRAAGYSPLDWTVVRDFPASMIISNRNGKDYAQIKKIKPSRRPDRKGS